MKRSLLTLSATVVLAFSPGIFAEQVDFTISGNGFSGSGVFDVTPATDCTQIDTLTGGGPCPNNSPAGIYVVNDVASGTLNGNPLTLDPNPSAFGNISNLVYLNGGPNLDSFGVLLDWSGDPDPLNLVYDPTLPSPDCTTDGSTTTTCNDAIWTAAPDESLGDQYASNGGYELPVSVTTTLTPEPGTLSMALLGGALALGATLRRRFRRV